MKNDFKRDTTRQVRGASRNRFQRRRPLFHNEGITAGPDFKGNDALFARRLLDEFCAVDHDARLPLLDWQNDRCACVERHANNVGRFMFLSVIIPRGFDLTERRIELCLCVRKRFAVRRRCFYASRFRFYDESFEGERRRLDACDDRVWRVGELNSS